MEQASITGSRAKNVFIQKGDLAGRMLARAFVNARFYPPMIGSQTPLNFATVRFLFFSTRPMARYCPFVLSNQHIQEFK
jgi:hypothetical protein